MALSNKLKKDYSDLADSLLSGTSFSTITSNYAPEKGGQRNMKSSSGVLSGEPKDVIKTSA